MLLYLLTKAENFHLMHLDFLPLTRIMDQDLITSTEVAVKPPTTLENIPEDVAGIIAEQIQGWAGLKEILLKEKRREGESNCDEIPSSP